MAIMLNRNQLDPAAYELLQSVLDGQHVAPRQAGPLLGSDPRLLESLGRVADELRRRQVGDVVTYVVNRNINFTNVCIKQCGFCAFSRDYRTEQAYFLEQEEIERRVDEAMALGATEVCVQAGLPPKMDGWLYVNLTRNLKSRFPKLHLHAFSPEEVLYGSVRAKVSISEYLAALKEAGLDSLPGTSAEMLVPELRQRISPGRITVDQWTEVITQAHRLGLPTTSTMMFGHAETPQQWLEHLQRLSDIQSQTGGFSEFVPLGFVHKEAPMFLKEQEGVRPGAQEWESLSIHSLARILLGHQLTNIQVSWVKEGWARAQRLLQAGCNDLGGTLMNESISTSAGSAHGQLLQPHQIRQLAYEVGRPAAQRNTLYGILRRFEVGEQDDSEVDYQAGRFGSYHQLVEQKAHRYEHGRSTLPASVTLGGR